LVEAKNVAEQLIYTSEKALKDAGDKVPADVKTSVEGKIADLKNVKDKDDMPAIKSATETLSTELSKIGQAMNQANQQSSEQPKQEGSGDVKEAEFEEKKPEDSK